MEQLLGGTSLDNVRDILSSSEGVREDILWGLFGILFVFKPLFDNLPFLGKILFNNLVL